MTGRHTHDQPLNVTANEPIKPIAQYAVMPVGLIVALRASREVKDAIYLLSRRLDLLPIASFQFCRRVNLQGRYRHLRHWLIFPIDRHLMMPRQD